MNAAQTSDGLSYRQAGVDIDAGDRLVEAIKPLARRTLRPEVLAGIGGFGGLFALSGKYREPVLVSGTDGVGTKLKLAFTLDRHDTVGIDLVAMSVNDILVQGAEPLFFLDYFSCGQLAVRQAQRVIAGIAEGCAQAGCALLGGETAEMPGMYPPGEYDLAGFAVGVAERARLIDGSTMQAGDVVLGLASSGVHSNGYSLVRAILAQAPDENLRSFDLAAPLPPLAAAAGMPPASPSGTESAADALMAPTRIYVKSILALLESVPVKAMAHITGGGIPGNLPRMFPETLAATLDPVCWTMPALFVWLQKAGRVSSAEMFRTFNCGLGMMLVVSAAEATRASDLLRASGETVWKVGEIIPRTPGTSAVQISGLTEEAVS